MALTDKQVYDLNNMNVAAQRADLGTFLNGLDAEMYIATKTLVAGDINTGVAAIPLVSGASILSYFVTASDGTVRLVTKAIVTGANALLTITGVVATDIVKIVYTK